MAFTQSAKLQELMGHYSNLLPKYRDSAPPPWEAQEQFREYLQNPDTFSTDSTIIEEAITHYEQGIDQVQQGQDGSEGGFLERVANLIKSFFTAMFSSFWEGVRGTWSWIAEHIFGFATGNLVGEDYSIWEGWLQSLVDEGFINEAEGKRIARMTEGNILMRSILMVTSPIQTSNNILNQGMNAALASKQKVLNKAFTPAIINPQEILRAAIIDPGTSEAIRTQAAEAGYSDEQINLMFKSLWRPLDDTQIRDMYLRGVLSEDQMIKRMRENGFTDDRIEELTAIWDVLPPVNDMVRFAYRALFNEETRNKWPWMYQAPPGFAEESRKLGLSQHWAEMYWAAHWTQPGLEQTFEMLHRNKISKDDVVYALEARGFSQYWQDRLVSISYRPYTRVDTRRMHDLGILSTEGVYNAYRDIGYDEEKARNMTNFTIRYNQPNERDVSRTMIEDAYTNGEISKERAIELLKKIGYREATANFVLKVVDMQQRVDLREDRLSLLEDQYKNGLIDESTVLDHLNDTNLGSQRIEYLIDRWRLDRFAARQLPSKTDIEIFYKQGIITKERATEYLRGHKYNGPTIEEYFQLWDKQIGEG